MESDFLSMYHQAHFRPIGHEIVRMKNNSLSSESSFNQSGPEYSQDSVSQSRLTVDSNTVNWDQIQTINMTQTSHDTSCDYKSFGVEEYMEDGEELEKAICRQEMNVNFYDDKVIQFDKSLLEACECCDYEVIVVNPDLVDISSDDDQHDLEAEYRNGDDRSYREVNHEDRNTISQDGLGIDLDSPLLFNIDEYLIDNNNNNNKHLLNTDDVVVKDNVKEELLNNNNFFIKHKLSVKECEKESIQFNIPVSTPNIEECLISDVKKDLVEENAEIDNKTDNCKVIDQNSTNNEDISIDEADLAVLPNFEGLKDYFLPDMTKTKFSNIETSYLSPQSPMQNIGKDIDEIKTCMRVNGDLSDLASDNDMNSTENASKSDVMPQILTDKVNNYQIIINNKIEGKLVSGKNDLDHKDVEIKRPKKLDSLSKLKGGQILFEPEFSSNSRSPIPRSCKSKRVVYYPSSDNKSDNNVNDKKITKKSVKPLFKSSKCHKKLSPPHRELDSFREKPNSSVTNQSAFKASDSCSEKSTNGIKLTIKNKSQVVLHWQHIESQKDRNMDKNEETQEKNIKELETSNGEIVSYVETDSIKEKSCPENKNGILNSLDKGNNEQNFFDPIKEAARVVLLAKKRKAEAMRKKEEDIVNSRLSKTKNLQLQPLFSNAETLKIVGMIKPEITPVPMKDLQSFSDYEKRILINMGTNTDEKMFSYVEEPVVDHIIKATSPSAESKFTNLKNKSDHGLKTDKKSIVDEKTHSKFKLDKERYKNIMITLESVRKQVDTKILRNSLFSSIQDVVLKNAPKEAKKHDEKHTFLQDKRDYKFAKTKIVREYDPKADYGEDKVVLHLDKRRCKPSFSNKAVQTDPVFAELPISAPTPKSQVGAVNKKRKYSDLSLSRDEKRSHKSNEHQLKKSKPEERVLKQKELRSEQNEKRSWKITPPLREPTVSKSSDPSSSSSSSSCSSSSTSSSSSSSSTSSSSSSSSRRSRGSCNSYKRDETCKQMSYRRESNAPEEERKIVFVGRMAKDVTKQTLRNQFSKFGRVTEVRIHTKKDGYRYGFVTYQRARDAWSAVEASSTFPQYNVGFGGRRAFCRQSYADLDGLDFKPTEKAYFAETVPPLTQRDDDISFDQMLLDLKKKLGQRKYGRPKS